MVSKLISFVLAVFLVLGCSKKSPLEITASTTSSGIVNGVLSEPNSLVALSTVGLGTLDKEVIDGETRLELHMSCTGTLVSEDIVITAAHCLTYFRYPWVLRESRVKLGTERTSHDLQNLALEIESLEIHPGFRALTRPENEDDFITTINDIGVVKLKTKIPAPFQPVAIIDQDLRLEDGADLVLAGWGYTKFGNKKTADFLYETDVKLHSYWATHLLTNQLNGKGACGGDSGGPAYVFDEDGSLVVVGATRGPLQPYEKCDYFGEYTNLGIHKEFIIKAVDKLGGAQPTFVTPVTTTPFNFDLTLPNDFNRELMPLRPGRRIKTKNP